MHISVARLLFVNYNSINQNTSKEDEELLATYLLSESIRQSERSLKCVPEAAPRNNPFVPLTQNVNILEWAVLLLVHNLLIHVHI